MLIVRGLYFLMIKNNICYNILCILVYVFRNIFLLLGFKIDVKLFIMIKNIGVFFFYIKSLKVFVVVIE